MCCSIWPLTPSAYGWSLLLLESDVGYVKIPKYHLSSLSFQLEFVADQISIVNCICIHKKSSWLDYRLRGSIDITASFCSLLQEEGHWLKKLFLPMLIW